MFMLVLAVSVLVLLVWRLWRQDCDLTLEWNLRFGKSPEALKGRVVWVTGCSSGIGEALVLEFARAGCRLVLSARREDLLVIIKQRCIEVSGGRLSSDDVMVLPLDLLKHETHADAAEHVLKYFKQIDLLVNNAGRSQRSLIVDTAVEVDRQVLDLDLLAPISLTKAVLPHMIARGRGHVMCTSSVAGKLPAPGSATYSAAKHGLQGFFDTLRIECAPHNIAVTMACPGPVFSDALLHAFTDKPGQTLNVPMDRTWSRMTAARCAQLMVVAAANGLHEVWVTPNPELLFCYLFQYAPYIARKAP
ncbi:DHRS7-like protein [Mya arenaria]|uniref:DHRS7-like protein n=1 Tax=Mya arenaria TaxID=6604 RepID=A0ABY7FII8_MYAAR|nr:DHRS7-like protein [Mya arenaria]